MSIAAIGVVSPQVTHTTGGPEPSFADLVKTHPDAADAAQQFEAVFLKQLLSSVEKAPSISGGTSDTQSSVVGAMMTGALSEQLSAGGGIGLSEVILRAMVARLPEPPQASPALTAEDPVPALEPTPK